MTAAIAAGAVLIVAATYWGQHVEQAHRHAALVDAASPEAARRLTSA